jgi:hypothetical protein
MKRFAILDENNVVTGITTGGDEDTESALTSVTNVTHKETFLDRSARKNVASIGGTYNPNLDAFIWPSPCLSWTLNEDTCQWQPPTAMPDDGKMYTWDEENTQWVEKPE